MEELAAFLEMKKWEFDPVSGNLCHESGKFFSIEGVRVQTNWGNIHEWEQPIINQPEIGFLGFITKKVETNDSNLEVILEEDLLGLDEVTVVAYGTQKKASVIAAVTSINPEELRVPTSNLTSSIAGRVAGVISYQRSGEPGRDNAEFFIRGVSTFGYARSPLILIDGIETTSTDLARLQPDDIASFSIMKDATATALYGARGANGVILVTTKEGKEGVVKINVRYEKAYSAPTKSLEIADPVTYMTLHNEALATRNPLGGRIYSLEKNKYLDVLTNNFIAIIISFLVHVVVQI